MAILKTILRTMTKQQQQRSKKLNWEGMSKCCFLSSQSDGTHLPPVPKWRSEGMSKPWSLERETSGGIQDDRPAYSPPAYSPPAYESAAPAAPAAYKPPLYCASQRYVGMGLLRPANIYESINMFRPPRWWEVKFKKPWRLPSGANVIQDDRPAPQLSMTGSNSNWEGRLKRRRLGHTFRRFPNYSVQDVVAKRVLTYAEYFKVHEDPDDLGIDSFEPEQFEYWLDEVQGYFEFMELAHEFHSVGSLFPLLHHVLVYPHAAGIRAKTAELVTTMVHNNPRSQQLVMELHGLQPLWYNFTSDPDVTSRTKALGAISALVRNNKLGITAFREKNGYAALGDALSSENVWFQREALNLIHYLLHENSSDCNTVTELGLPRIMMHLASSDDAEVREAALRGLLVLARDEEGTFLYPPGHNNSRK